MKSAIILPFVLLVGLIIGGWAPKEDLRLARKQVDALKAKLSEQDKSQRLDSLTRIVQIPDRAQRPHSRVSVAPKSGVPAGAHLHATNTAARLSVAAVASSNAAAQCARVQKEPPKAEDLRARIDEAKELWVARVEIARAQWIERLKLSQENAALFDGAINAMNENLYAAMQGLANGVASAEALTPEDGVRAFGEMTSVLVRAYDEINAIVPASQQQDVANMELTDFVDPAIAEPLVAIQDKLEAVPSEHRSVMRLRR